VLSWSPLALEACLTTEVPEYAENEPKSICLLEAESHLGKRHVYGQKGSAMPPENMQLGLRKSASPDRHGLEAMIFVTAVEIVYMLVCTLE
jgi:hypothetical protein